MNRSVPRLARTIQPKDPMADTKIVRRLGTVVVVNTDTVDIILGGASSEETIADVAYLNSYVPAIDDIVWVDLKGGNPLVIGSTAATNFSPNVPSNWDGPPETILQALNELAARLRALE